MFARVGIFQSTPERVDDDEARQAREQMLQTLQGLPGFAGLYVLGDRQTGKTIGISLWETEAGLDAWEQMRGGIVRNQAAAAGHTEQKVPAMRWCSTPRPTELPDRHSWVLLSRGFARN